MDKNTISLDEAIIGVYFKDSNGGRSSDFPWTPKRDIANAVNNDDKNRANLQENTGSKHIGELDFPKNPTHEPKEEMGKVVEKAVVIPQSHSSSQRKASPKLSQVVSAAVYSTMLGSNHSHTFRADWDTEYPRAVSTAVESTNLAKQRTHAAHKLEKGLKERMILSRRMIRNPGGSVFGNSKPDQTENKIFKDNVLPNTPSDEMSQKHGNDKRSVLDYGKHTSQNHYTCELIDIEDCDLDSLMDDHSRILFPLDITSSEKNHTLKCSKDITEQIETKLAFPKLNETVTKIPKKRRNVNSKKKKSKKFLKIESAKVFPIENSDEGYKASMSKEYIAKVAEMFCVEKAHKAHIIREIIDDDDDTIFQPGIWDCNLLDSVQKEPCSKEELKDNIGIKSERNLIEEKHADQSKKSKKKENRILKFIRNLFKKK